MFSSISEYTNGILNVTKVEYFYRSSEKPYYTKIETNSSTNARCLIIVHNLPKFTINVDYEHLDVETKSSCL